MSIDIKATPMTNGDIELDVNLLDDANPNIRENISREIIKTKEKVTHDALIALGWTPPVGDAPIVADIPMLVDAVIGKGFVSDAQRITMNEYGYANKEGWNREALSRMKQPQLISIYMQQA